MNSITRETDAVRLIDNWLPQFDTSASHAIAIRASREKVYASLVKLDMRDSRLIRLLFAIRSFNFTFRNKEKSLGLTLDGLKRNGFVMLDENPQQELVLGLVGKFWTPSGTMQRLSRDEFSTFTCQGFAKAAWNFFIEEDAGITILSTETRIVCTDAASRRKFFRYWFIVKPFSGLIRKAMLRTIKRQAEQQ